MKIGIVTTMNALAWAGSEELWFGAARRLLAQGHAVDVYYPALRGSAPQLDELRAAGAKVHAFGWRSPRMTHLMGQLGKRWRGLPVAYPFPGDAAWKSLDRVLVSQGACLDGQPWLDALQRAGVPYSILCQANMESLWPDDDTAQRVCDYYAGARGVYFVSQENRRLFEVQTGYAGSNTAVVWNPLQPSTPAQALDWPAGDADGPLRLAIVGRIEPFAKGQDLAIEVMSMDKWRARDVRVTLFGRGPWARTAQRIIERRGVSAVSLGGFATPREIWEKHHLLALPSRHEGMSLAMLEAMWLGRPVLATAVAGAISEIEDGVNGFLCQAASVASWDDGMERAWQARARWRAMGAAAAATIRARMPADPAAELARLLVDGGSAAPAQQPAPP